jgi:hypothetical protein
VTLENFDLYLKKRLTEVGIREPELHTVDASLLPPVK